MEHGTSRKAIFTGKAVAYARRWAFGRNPDYYDFSRLGGDCTNYASQVLFAGAGVMNFTPTYGWYYARSTTAPLPGRASNTSTISS